MERFQIKYDPRVFREDVPKLDRVWGTKIMNAIYNKLVNSPLHFSVPLRRSLIGFSKLRVGDYRVIFKIISNDEVYIVGIMHRSKVYKELRKRV